MEKRVERSFLDPQVISRLAGLPLHARFPVLGSVSGMHRSPVRGSSLEFSEYRKYVPGDDKRRLDWRAYGRSDRFYVREFEADTNLRMCLIVDTSGSMGFRGDGLEKLDYARRLAGTLAYLAARQGDAVGLYCAARSFHKEIPPRRSASHLRFVLDELAEVRARGETGLIDALHEAAEKIPQRALIIIISDLFVSPPLLRDSFQHLRFRRHDVAAFHLFDPRELNFDCPSTTRFVDMETGESLVADPSVITRHYLKALHNYMDDILQAARESEVDYHMVDTAKEYGDVLARFLLGRSPKVARGRG